MKKKILSLCLVVAMVATAVVGASMAYLTDTEEAVNVMTVGNVDIELIEQQRDGNGGLEDFEQNKVLYPIVGTAQGEKDGFGLPNAANYVDKIVSVKNTGKSDAWVRVVVAVPSALEATTAAANALHWNVGNRFMPKGDYSDNNNTNVDYTNWSWSDAVKGSIDGVDYNIYTVTYNKALSAKTETASAAFVGFYLDSNVDYDADTGKYTLNGVEIDYDFSNGVIIPVMAQAVQAAGFETADAAFDAAGFSENPWANTAIVSTDEELDAAIEGGADTVILGDGNYIIPDSAQGKTLTIVGNGNTVIAVQDDGSYEGCDYSLQGSTVTFENVTINTDSSTYTGYARLNATYNNCTINGTYTLYGNSVFNDCTFNVSGDAYNIWTWGAGKATFNDCTFNCDGKSILVYNSSCDVTVNNCFFNDNGDGTVGGKAAIETGCDNAETTYHNITVNNTSVSGFEVNTQGISTDSTLWANKNSMDKDHLNVIVDGDDVY